MQNDFVPVYDDESEESIELTVVDNNAGSKVEKNSMRKSIGFADNDKGLNKLCKSVDCLNTIADFVAVRPNPRLQELFEAFNAEFSKTIEDQLLKRLELAYSN